MINFFWGRRIFDLQLGPKPIPLRSITHEHFDQTLNDLISNKIYYNHACHLFSKINNENGLDTVIQHIEKECVKFKNY